MPRRAVLVSGGAGGIGSAICRRLADRGAEVVILDLESARGEELAGELGARFLAADLAELGEVELGRIVAEAGELEGLVNAAGIADEACFPAVPITEWRRVQAVNLEAPFLLTQALAGQIVDGGSVVNVASVAGLRVLTVSGRLSHPYSASKAGLLMLTRTLAKELAPRRIRVNAVSPGFVRTPIIDELDADRRGRVEALTPLGRWGEPDEVAKLVDYLLGDDAVFLTGANLTIDGGISG